MMIHTIRTIRTLILVITVLSCSTLLAQYDMPPATVVVAKATRTMLAPSVDVPGTVMSRFDARLASELSAKIVWIAEVGTRVEKGEAVARLEDIIFRLQEMEMASEVKREEARVRFLKSEVERLEKLALENNAAVSLLEKTISDLGVAESEEAIARARLGRAQVAMAVTEIKAPFDGIVTERLRNIGERLTIADEVIRLVDPSSVEVVARAPLNTINFIAENDELEIHNEYRDGRATVRTIVPFGDPRSHMFEVRLSVDADIWIVGESVRVPMPTSLAREVLTVPRDALVLRREGASVFRINADMVAEKISVITGLGSGPLIEVIGEIEAGDTVVIRGAERLKDGMSVQIGSGLSKNATNSSTAAQ
jgi:RND family efflux transporter MFP subunit